MQSEKTVRYIMTMLLTGLLVTLIACVPGFALADGGFIPERYIERAIPWLILIVATFVTFAYLLIKMIFTWFRAMRSTAKKGGTS